MVALVLVSHSAELAKGLADLAGQMTQGRVPIIPAGGAADGRLGTDATWIATSIERVWSPDGVLVLMDLGSAVMSAETALELLEPGQAARVRLSDGPMVEGAVAAAVQAAVGSPLEAVEQAAREALSVSKLGR